MTLQRRPWREVTIPGTRIHLGSKVYTLLAAEAARPFTARKVRGPDGAEHVSRVDLNAVVEVEVELGSTSDYAEPVGADVVADLEATFDRTELATAVVAARLGGEPFLLKTASGSKIAPATMLPGTLRAHLLYLHGIATLPDATGADLDHDHAREHAAGSPVVPHTHEEI